jgi:hypothetical protein
MLVPGIEREWTCVGVAEPLWRSTTQTNLSLTIDENLLLNTAKSSNSYVLNSRRRHVVWVLRLALGRLGPPGPLYNERGLLGHLFLTPLIPYNTLV